MFCYNKHGKLDNKGKDIWGKLLNVLFFTNLNSCLHHCSFFIPVDNLSTL